MSDTPKTDALREMLKQPCSCQGSPRSDAGRVYYDHDEFCPWANGEALAVREFEKLERELNEAKALYDATVKTAHATLNAQLRAEQELNETKLQLGRMRNREEDMRGDRDKWRECARELAKRVREITHYGGPSLARFDELEKGGK